MPGKTPVWVILPRRPDDAELQRTGGHMVFPDERVAVVELTNQDSVDASAAITRKIVPLLFMHDDASKEEQQSRAVFEGWQRGKINRSLFTDNANSYFTEQALQKTSPAAQARSAHRRSTPK